jgi:hypothetical protein
MAVEVIPLIVALPVAVLLIAVIRWRHRRRDASVFGSVSEERADDSATGLRFPADRLTGPVAPSSGADGPPDLSQLIGGLRQAAADGHLSDDEIQRLMPGAQVVRDGDGISIEQVRATRSEVTEIVDANGVRYDSIDDIPDPAVRERIRKALDSQGF